MPRAQAPLDASIHYDVVGHGAPVALIAGMGGAASFWKPQIAALSARYQLILHDQRGCGASSRGALPYSVPMMGDDFLAVLDDLGIEAAHCVGHAAGAAIAQDVALRHPDRIASIVMVGAWARVDPYFRRVFEIRKDLLRNSGRLAYVRAMPLFLNTPAWVSRNIAKLEAEEPAFADHLPPDEILLGRIDAFSAWEPGEALSALTCPVLIASAEDDHLVPIHCAHDMARIMPSAQTHTFATGGHSMSQTDPDTFNDVVLKFLDAVTHGAKVKT
jgi:aminoacrylate hydrolase